MVSGQRVAAMLLLFNWIVTVLVLPCAGADLAGDFEFVELPPGSFLMGSSDAERGRPNESPIHRVMISQGVFLARYEVTQAQWQKVMGDHNPSAFIGEDLPVDTVSWHDVQLFLKRLNILDPGRGYRLPTEAEWEYAARAGISSGQDVYGAGRGQVLSRFAWYTKSSKGHTHPVGGLLPNAWGFYDMYGNVSEWVGDRYARDYYQRSPLEDPTGPVQGRKRVLRGGSWINPRISCRPAARTYYSARYLDSDIGFRLARVAQGE